MRPRPIVGLPVRRELGTRGRQPTPRPGGRSARPPMAGCRSSPWLTRTAGHIPAARHRSRPRCAAGYPASQPGRSPGRHNPGGPPPAGPGRPGSAPAGPRGAGRPGPPPGAARAAPRSDQAAAPRRQRQRRRQQQEHGPAPRTGNGGPAAACRMGLARVAITPRTQAAKTSQAIVSAASGSGRRCARAARSFVARQGAGITQECGEHRDRCRVLNPLRETMLGPGAVAVLAALLRDARAPPQTERTRRTSTPAA